MIELGLKFTLSYLLGSLLGSLVVGWLRGGVDIRKLGSGNAGGTNALRTQGKWFALGVMVIDVGKGILGTNREYLVQLAMQLDALGIEDPYVEELHAQIAAATGA